MNDACEALQLCGGSGSHTNEVAALWSSLAACYSEPPAAALLTRVDCIVGMRGSIRDDAARSFAIGFYGV